jgi:uncharacterized membrane protein YhhN
VATTSTPFLALAFLTAIVDWIAVDSGVRRPATATAAKPVEYVAKPLVMLFLVIAALIMAHEHRAPGPHHAAPVVVIATVIALVLSLVGDVFLMLPEDSPRAEANFIAGLGSFLGAHIAYIVAFVRLHNTESSAISFVTTGLVLAIAAFTTVGRRVVAGAKAADAQLGGPVLAYVTVISLMVVTAWWTGDMRIILGALLFAFSDAVIGWTKFIKPDPRGPLTLIATYHLAQILLVLGLLRR